MEIEELEQDLWQKEQVLWSVTRRVEKIHRRRKKLECDRDDLTDRLSKMGEDFNREVDRAERRNKSLERTVAQKEREITQLVCAMKELQKDMSHSRKSCCRSTGRLSRTKGNITKNDFSTSRFQIWSAPQTPKSSSTEDMGAEAGMCTISGDLSIETFSSVATSTYEPIESEFTLANFLGVLREFSNSSKLSLVGNGEINKETDTYAGLENDIRRYYENWNEFSCEEVINWLNRALREWNREKTRRTLLEEEVIRVKCEHDSTIRQICRNLVEISATVYQPISILYLPQRMSHWGCVQRMFAFSFSLFILLAKTLLCMLGSIITWVIKRQC